MTIYQVVKDHAVIPNEAQIISSHRTEEAAQASLERYHRAFQRQNPPSGLTVPFVPGLRIEEANR